ncbi:hypothetical protein GGX14DRAFT_384311 [Mycena pura]|uniref:Uncharacterized protein n=1 Tax=Mycena pura TaxID=153505 RepID=A0AAD6YVY9_9AGAR|nr:hypothetical protein GGX14DRAFT_384311 [Mycena pura]
MSAGMTLEEAAAWVYPRDYRPNFDDDLRDLYPDLTEMDRGWAWAADNKAAIRQAMLVCITTKPEHFETGIGIDLSSTSSFFYWNPSTIGCEHEGFIYIVRTASHVAALHAMGDKAAALAYLQTHFDERHMVRPKHCTIPEGWRTCPGSRVPLRADSEGKAGTRYTLVNWRKMAEARTTLRTHGVLAMVRFYEENYDVKQRLDPQGNFLSYGRAPGSAPALL